MWHQFDVMMLKGHGKFGGKVTTGFQLCLEKSVNFVPGSQRVEISNLMGCLFL